MKKIFIALFLLLVITPILLGGYFGLVPGVSALFGSNKPRNLGVVTTPESLSSANQKTQVELKTLPSDTPADQSLQYQGQRQVELTLTSEELTSMANNSSWKYSPVSNVQIRINPDGSGEASGLIDFSAAVEYAKALGVSPSDIDVALQKYPIPKTKFPFYVKLSGSVTNNDISANVTSLELARIPVPSGIISELTPAAIGFVESKYLSHESIHVDSLSNQAGAINFKGTIPETELTVGR